MSRCIRKKTIKFKKEKKKPLNRPHEPLNGSAGSHMLEDEALNAHACSTQTTGVLDNKVKDMSRSWLPFHSKQTQIQNPRSNI